MRARGMVLVTTLLFILVMSMWVFSALEANILLAKVSSRFATKQLAMLARLHYIKEQSWAKEKRSATLK